MDNVTITSNSSNLVVNRSIIAQNVNTESISTESINVTDDVYINSAIYTPVGSIITYAGTTAPAGWLFCDGSEVTKTTYARLYAVIGTTYGTASNGTKFVLPNLADRIPVGKSGATSVGNTGGNSSVTLSVEQLPSHTHTGTTDVSGVHTHTGTTDVSGAHTHTGTTDSNGSHTHGITDPGHTHSQTTINDDFNNSGGNPPGFAADSAGSRTWNNISTAYTGISVNSGGSHAHTFTTGASSTHAHTFTTGASSTHAHTFTTNATGSGSSIDIRNKYVVLNYIIRY